MTSIVASISMTDDVVNLSRESKNDENKLQKRMIISTLHHIFKTLENEVMYELQNQTCFKMLHNYLNSSNQTEVYL